MIIKIEDISFENKGAELMLMAIIAQLKEKYGNELKIVVDSFAGTRLQKAKYNLFREIVLQRFKIK